MPARTADLADTVVHEGAAGPGGSGDTQVFEPSSEESDAADFLLGNDTAEDEADPVEAAERPDTDADTDAASESAAGPPAGRRRPAADTEPAAADDPAPAAAPKGAPVLGDDQLVKKLGAGGMGTVYLAHQVSLDRPVALKVLARELAAKPDFVSRFRREARVMARLDYPNLLRCYEIGQAAGRHYLAMEYVEGGSLEGVLLRRGKLSVAGALHVTLACARGLEHAHELNLVHRDVKPDNVLLTKKGVVKVADLGLAKAIDDDLGLTKSGTGAGTPRYMSPEQARDVKRVDARSDACALGVMLYRLLTGALPFAGDTMVELTEAKERGKFARPRQLNGEVPPRLELILDKMLASDPRHRFQSCAELIAELEALGLAGDRLSFVAAAAGKPARPAPARPATPAAPAPAPAPSPPEEEKSKACWYLALQVPGGRPFTRKVTQKELKELIKREELNPETPVSRTLHGGYRALATYPEFAALLRGRAARDKADRKSEKYQGMYAKLEQEEKSRQRWRWLHNLYLSTGRLLGLLLWLAVIVGVLVAGYYLVPMGYHALTEKLSTISRPEPTEPANKAPGTAPKKT